MKGCQSFAFRHVILRGKADTILYLTDLLITSYNALSLSWKSEFLICLNSHPTLHTL